MFFNRSARAVAMAETAIKQSFLPFTHIMGQPPRFWLDPFVLGFTSAITICCTRVAYKTMPDTPTQTSIYAQVHHKLSSLNPAIVGPLLPPALSDPGFGTGFDAAMKVFLFANQRLDNEFDDKDVLEAVRMVKVTGEKVDREAVGAMLHMLLVNGELQNRFS